MIIPIYEMGKKMFQTTNQKQFAIDGPVEIVDLPIKNVSFPVCKVLLYQRVGRTLQKCHDDHKSSNMQETITVIVIEFGIIISTVPKNWVRTVLSQ